LEFAAVRKVILGLLVLIGATAQLLQAQQTPPLAASPARPPDAAALGAVHSNIAYDTGCGHREKLAFTGENFLGGSGCERGRE
jgi:hypothetical protein